MIEQVSLNDFMDRFRAYDRQDNFSYEGLEALFNYYEELEESMEKPIELDVIAICCERAEYDSIEDAINEYGDSYDFETLSGDTTVIELDNNHVLVQAF